VRLRVLHVLNELRPSGAEVMLRVAAGEWAKYDVVADIVSLGDSVGDYAKELSDAGYGIKHVPYRGLKLAFLLQLIKCFSRYDVIHIHTERGNARIALAGILAGKRVLRTVHNAFDYPGFQRFARIVLRNIISRLGVVHVSIGKTVGEVEGRYLLNQTVCVPNWFDVARYRPPSSAERAESRRALGIRENSLVLLVVGNCSAIKNHSALFDALSNWGDVRDYLVLHVGSGEDEVKERALCQHMGVAKSVSFLGKVSNPLFAYQAADAYVMLSTKEGFSIAALEAIASGLPCIFSDVHGLRDLKDAFNESCLWVDLNRASIVDGLNRLLDQIPQKKIHALKNSERCMEMFGPEVGVKKYYEIYSDF
jgi:glycosyltransferase involved in cell wall biosynthesis